MIRASGIHSGAMPAYGQLGDLLYLLWRSNASELYVCNFCQTMTRGPALRCAACGTERAIARALSTHGDSTPPRSGKDG
ncbi:hypothetical protein QTH89_07200 [Variovorax sp. J22G21]|uniref:hypothetical protein n=1 Tax=Variovorax fucosicus TaxID=3053517 RepID=UPI002578B5E6|nr:MULTISPECIES: hypothetical protein [unclassified Variovorax]MDM0042385.1 hypothetical protein [Variovorax sp. J22R193]MDM0060990.1 hypothetical protein [Variovorax sp. J22G21]